MEIALKVLVQRERNCGVLGRPEERMQVSGKLMLRQESNYFIRAPVVLGIIEFRSYGLTTLVLFKIEFFSAVLSGTSNCYFVFLCLLIINLIALYSVGYSHSPCSFPCVFVDSSSVFVWPPGAGGHTLIS